MIIPDYNKKPLRYHTLDHEIADFLEIETIRNADNSVIQSFGEEWKKFSDFKDDDLNKLGSMYFDILPDSILSKDTSLLDVGCGTGRWAKYLSSEVGHIDLLDPSDAIFVAAKGLSKINNVRFSKSSADNIPFPDNSFDMVMSVGVLHHIPDTFLGIQECVKKVKPGGLFYVYLYYNLDNRGFLFRLFFKLGDMIRRTVSRMPDSPKKITCDLLAVFVYMPFILLSRFFCNIGLRKLADKIPLSAYRNKSFYIIRNDSLDRFGTKLEHRFSKSKIKRMMESCGLTNINFSVNAPFWHATGIKKSN